MNQYFRNKRRKGGISWLDRLSERAAKTGYPNRLVYSLLIRFLLAGEFLVDFPERLRFSQYEKQQTMILRDPQVAAKD